MTILGCFGGTCTTILGNTHISSPSFFSLPSLILDNPANFFGGLACLLHSRTSKHYPKYRKVFGKKNKCKNCVIRIFNILSIQHQPNKVSMAKKSQTCAIFQRRDQTSLELVVDQSGQRNDVDVGCVAPPPCNSDVPPGLLYAFLVSGILINRPSFATVTGRGATPKVDVCFFQKWKDV